MKSTQIYSTHITSSQKETLINSFPSVFDEDSIDKNNFKLIFENNEAPNILYHYTSIKTLQSILERIEDEEKRNLKTSNSNCFALRGTHIEFLNDITEFKLTGELLAELIKTYENSLKAIENKHIADKLNHDYWKGFVTLFGYMTPPFITSFSENPDSLPMWNTYGINGKGVAIGIERMKIDDLHYKSKSGNPSWVRCAYDSKLLKDILSKAAKDIYSLFEPREGHLVFNGFPNISDLAAYFSLLKNFAFEYEQEWRLIKNYSASDYEKEIKFQEKDGILKPYVEHLLPKKILKEIIIGPGSEMEMLQKSLDMSLKRAGYSVNQLERHKDNFVEIKLSRVPYRHI
ncbi:MAG: DUF2971 domain-containing protein [Prolixibacteraceae bacterium]|nr:DUF2971 domain-containing protein [Prolixibacteraceae bacterium]